MVNYIDMKKEYMKKEYWYKFFIEECPVCGRSSEWKERIYDKPRPKKKEDRYKFNQTWCHCNQ
jgi:hypothetical protein